MKLPTTEKKPTMQTKTDFCFNCSPELIAILLSELFAFIDIIFSILN